MVLVLEKKKEIRDIEEKELGRDSGNRKRKGEDKRSKLKTEGGKP